MPLYKFHVQIQGPYVFAAGHVYDISNDYAEALNTEKPGCCEKWTPEKAAAGLAAGEPEPEVHAKKSDAPLLSGDAWRAKGEQKKRIGTGV
jgi:hypothetical protein